jgi:AbrB family looped-hinge helix DNA binding protein
MSVVTVSSKGQIVLPKELREELEIQEGDSLEIQREGDGLHLRRLSSSAPPAEWRAWRGILAGSGALEEHLREHREEIERERLP